MIFNELAFGLICEFCKNDIDCIYNRLLKVEKDSFFPVLGFWVWDIPNNFEMYSPRFRETLGFESEEDFPNVPESWKSAILETDLGKAINNFNAHVKTKGEAQYLQDVTYRKKDGTEIFLTCHGKVVSWIGDDPKIMIGVHVETEPDS